MSTTSVPQSEELTNREMKVFNRVMVVTCYLSTILAVLVFFGKDIAVIVSMFTFTLGYLMGIVDRRIWGILTDQKK